MSQKSRQPCPGDIIASYGKVGLRWSHLWESIRESVVTAGIVGFQAWKGYAWPAARTTHVIYYVGSLSPDRVKAAIATGLLTVEAGAALLVRDDWCFSMTWPRGTWERWEEAKGARPSYVVLEWDAGMQRPDPQMVERHLWPMLGLHYDEYQLLGILLHGLIGMDETVYKHWVDRGGKYTVCSGAIAAALEKTRREVEDAGGTAWPRLCGGMHAEVFPPAAFWSRPRGAAWLPPYRRA